MCRSPIRFFIVALLLCAVTTAAQADSADSQKILDRTLETLGGRRAIGQLRSLAVEADCTGPGGDFHTRVDSFFPGMTYFEQTAGDEVTRIWSTPERTWHQEPDGTIEPLDANTRYFLRSHEFHLLLFELESRFSDHHLAGLDSIGGTPCRLIEMIDESGRPASICIAESDGLPRLLELNPEGAQGSVRITFEDWREIEGLRYFSAFRLTEGPDRVFTYRYRRLEPDAVPADLFVAPAPPSQRGDQEALLEILRQDRRAHLETDASLVSPHLAETLVEISAGRVNSQTRNDVVAFFETMFEGAEYQIWEDAVPPLIRISSDAAMAWVARIVRVRREAPGPDGRSQVQAFTSAYTSTYEKQDGDWKMASVTSTFRPE